jgi:hypothetical protein
MKRILTALVAAATLAGAALATSAPAEARWGWGWGWGLGGFALGAAVGSALAAPLCVASCMERLRLGARLRLTDRSRKPSRGKQLRRFPGGNASHVRKVAIFGT